MSNLCYSLSEWRWYTGASACADLPDSLGGVLKKNSQVHFKIWVLVAGYTLIINASGGQKDGTVGPSNV